MRIDRRLALAGVRVSTAASLKAGAMTTPVIRRATANRGRRQGNPATLTAYIPDLP